MRCAISTITWSARISIPITRRARHRRALAGDAGLDAGERAQRGAHGVVSSDRTIREYAEEIWNVPVRPLADRDKGVRGARA